MYQPLFDFILRHEIITIFSHVYPDGDAIGSMVGLREMIKKNYPQKEVFVVGTNVVPFSYILGDFAEVSDEIIAESGAIIVDVGNGARVLDQRFTTAQERLKFDHHIFAETFCEVEIINNKRIATAEMLTEFMLMFKLDITPLGATALAQGIITDSGRFVYDLTSDVTFNAMAVLLQKGANLALINEKLSERSIDGLKERGYFLSNYQTTDKVIYIVLSNDERNSLNLKATDGSKYVNLYASIKGYPSWATLIEDEEGTFFVELRSKSHNVQKVAVKFRGGGHLKASGCRVKGHEITELLNELTNAEVL